MSVTIRPYNDDAWEADIRIRRPNGKVERERVKVPVSGKSAALRWAEAREQHLIKHGRPTKASAATRSMPTLAEFSPRFMDGHARANHEKPSGIAGKETILRVHLVPALGHKVLNAITTEDVQLLKAAMGAKAPKTINNALTVLNTLLKAAVSWGVIEKLPCVIKLLRVPKSAYAFYDFDQYECVLKAAAIEGEAAVLVALLGGEAGLRCGEMMALERTDIDFQRQQMTVERSEWKGHVTAPKGGRIRHLRLTKRLAAALRAARHLRGTRVLCDVDGRPLTQKVVQGIMRRVARRARVTGGVHILRHTFCSHLAMRGAPAKAIQELAGHQHLSTTMRYMHLSPAALDSAIGLLDEPKTGGFGGEIVEAAGKRR
jgi:integrase